MIKRDHHSEAITQGIRVTVNSQYDHHRSAPDRGLWLFLYTITIANEGTEPKQLIDRHWIITNEAGKVEEVKGPGVVGEQPLLAPGESFEYTSACPLDTPHGTMHGSYRFVDDNDQSLQVRVAEFSLTAPYLVN